MTTVRAPDLVARAYKLASELEAEGYSGIDTGQILSMALGIFMEGQSNSHREMLPLVESMLTAAQMTFDALRNGREGPPQ